MGGRTPGQKPPSERRFEEFFVEGSYVALKNYLYNYLERKRAINRALDGEIGLLLEVGSGLSPIVTGRDDVVYSELSFTALRTLKRAPHEGPLCRGGRHASTFRLVVVESCGLL